MAKETKTPKSHDMPKQVGKITKPWNMRAVPLAILTSLLVIFLAYGVVQMVQYIRNGRALTAGVGRVDSIASYTTMGNLASASKNWGSEASGGIASVRYPGMYYIHNDSGDANRIYRFTPGTGTSKINDVTFITVGNNISHSDWEEMSYGIDPNDNQPYMWIFETGNSRPGANTNFHIFRFPEPSGNTVPQSDIKDYAFKFYRPDGTTALTFNANVEAAYVDHDGIIWMINKSGTNKGSEGDSGGYDGEIFRLDVKNNPTKAVSTGKYVKTMVDGFRHWAISAALNPTYDVVAVSLDGSVKWSDYSERYLAPHVRFYWRAPGTSWADALSADPSADTVNDFSTKGYGYKDLQEAVWWKDSTTLFTAKDFTSDTQESTLNRLSLSITSPVVGNPGGNGNVAMIAAAGDIACQQSNRLYGGGSGVGDSCKQKAVSDLIRSKNPLYVLALGDLQYPYGQTSEFNTSYATSWGRFKDITLPTPGNHEYGNYRDGGSNPDVGADKTASGYYTYWAGKGFGTTGGASSSYYRVVGNWVILSLNSECGLFNGAEGVPGGCSAVADYAKSVINANPGKCLAAFWHRPAITHGGHGNEQYVIDTLWNAVVGKATFVMNGHNHFYSRSVPLNASGAQVAADTGTRIYVVGTGGYGTEGNNPDGTPVEDVNPQWYEQSYIRFKPGALFLELDSTNYKYSTRFIDYSNNMLDSLTNQDCIKLPSPNNPTPNAQITNFTITPASVAPGAQVAAKWTTAHATNCTMSYDTASGWNVAVQNPTGTTLTMNESHTVWLTCWGANNVQAKSSAGITVSRPAQVSIGNFTTDKTNVSRGGQVKLNWTTTNARTCTLGYDGMGWAPWPVEVQMTWAGGYTQNISQNSTLRLSCTGATGPVVSKTVAITVNQIVRPAIGSYLAAASSNGPANYTIRKGAKVYLRWTTTNATNCQLNRSTNSAVWSNVGVSTEYSELVFARTVFTLKCWNSNDAAYMPTQTVIVNVN